MKSSRTYSPDSYDREEGVTFLTNIFSYTYNRKRGNDHKYIHQTPRTKEEGVAILTETFPIPPAGTEEGRKLHAEK